MFSVIVLLLIVAGNDVDADPVPAWGKPALKYVKYALSQLENAFEDNEYEFSFTMASRLEDLLKQDTFFWTYYEIQLLMKDFETDLTEISKNAEFVNKESIELITDIIDEFARLVKNYMDSYATKEGSVAIATNNRVSTRSTRKSKSRVPTPRKLVESLTSRISSKKLGDGVMEAHREFIKESPTFFSYFKKENQSKNLKPDDQYIMAQAPFDTTTQADFFRMLSQLDLEAMVVMDDPKNSDFKYLFTENGTYGDVSVAIENGDEAEGYVIRNFTVNKSKLKAYCITGWSNDAEPPKRFLSTHEKIRNAIGVDCKHTLMLICKDGCSRCGLFCLLDSESERVRAKGRIKFAESVKNIRYHRSNCFDTQDLFEAASAIIIELAKKNTDSNEAIKTS
ncbi:Protein-tyrosine phosphatase [Teladorsagia circumcincta]|uniref:Protein-tyrosine phosphatase n=1 Tax=Teladorsagia circumcincta TaxID=45464 RepID=A0A2G9V227_TELCI|nr:Protein-tyrosine phosphatase [Teladorsagia circumcincta]